MDSTTSLPPSPADLPDESEDLQEPFSSQEANNGEVCKHKYHDDRQPSANASGRCGAATAVPFQQFGDSVHKDLSLPDYCVLIVNTRQFKRLNYLKQLGVAHHVFPGAEHTRLIHSMGVSHLALKLLMGLHERQPDELKLEKCDFRNVALAGLCHDLGHGPLSHVFEKGFLRRTGVLDWKHEDMSIKMLKHVLEDARATGVEPKDIDFIERLIQGVKPQDRIHTPVGKRFLYDIISNDSNGVDVDRMDYMQRDARMCGHNLDCDFNALIASARVIDDQICYPLSQCGNVWRVFSERVRLFREVYTHRKTKAVECMVVDALALANKALGFADKIREAKDFVKLHDGLLEDIKAYDDRLEFEALGQDDKESVLKAQKILHRLDTGNLYACCAECEVPEQMLMDRKWEKSKQLDFTADKVVAFHGASWGLGLGVADVILDENRIEYSKGGGDPMAAVGFFRDDDGPGCVKVSAGPDDLGMLQRPRCFELRTLRIFVREPEHREAAAAAFTAWCREHLGPEAPVDTELRDGRNQRAAAEPLRGSEDLRQGADPHRANRIVPLSPHPANPADTTGGEVQPAKRARVVHHNDKAAAV